jgi:hypothetical protein
LDPIHQIQHGEKLITFYNFSMHFFGILMYFVFGITVWQLYYLVNTSSDDTCGPSVGKVLFDAEPTYTCRLAGW